MTCHVASQQLKRYQDEMIFYSKSYPNAMFLAKQSLLTWGIVPLELKCVYYFEHKRLFTKKKTIKKMDVSNRMKASHDCLARILSIDDSWFFKVYAEKAPCEDGHTEHFSAEICPV